MKRILLAMLGLACIASPAAAITDEALLDTLQHGACQYFWDQANPSNGLIKDRSTATSPCSIASTGFGLSAICIGVDHGWLTRAQGAGRVLTTLQTFWNGAQGNSTSGTIGYKGLYWHWLDMSTATRTWDGELSTIDTALLFAGMLDARQFFNGGDATETQIRALADSIYDRADWVFMKNLQPGIKMGYKPGTGFLNFGTWTGYNEAMILYLLALGSPTHAVPASDWNTWTSGYNWNTQYGYTYLIFPPLFGHQYSHCWVDFRSKRDAFMQNHGSDYFENSRRATLAQRAYAVANPLGQVGYSDSLWGLTASDVPTGYNARGAPPGQNDDGTITPTAPIGSIPFAPGECLAVAHKLWDGYRANLWGAYGFRDAFNLTVEPDWYDTDYLGIDQGPIAIMIENYRTGRVWNRFMTHPAILQGLQSAGFTAIADVPAGNSTHPLELLPGTPNPFTHRVTLRYRLAEAGHVRLALFDVSGREVARLVDGTRAAGEHTAFFDAEGMPEGIYLVSLGSGGRRCVGKCVLVR